MTMDCVLLSIMCSLSFLPSTVEITMELYGDRFAKQNDSIYFNCSSDTVPVGMAANLHINEVSYSTTRLIDGECFSTVYGSICSLDICACSKKGLWYSHIYKIVQEEGSIITISCSMTFKQRSLSDSIQVQIVENKEWNNWTNWTLCSELCGGGSQNRSRSCKNPVIDYVWGNCIGDTTETNECNTHKCQIATTSFDFRTVIFGITAIGIFIVTATCSVILSRGRHCTNTIHIIGPDERSPRIPVYHSAPESGTTYHVYDDTNGGYLEVVEDGSRYNHSTENEDYGDNNKHQYDEIDYL